MPSIHRERQLIATYNRCVKSTQREVLIGRLRHRGVCEQPYSRVTTAIQHPEKVMACTTIRIAEIDSRTGSCDLGRLLLQVSGGPGPFHTLSGNGRRPRCREGRELALDLLRLLR